MSRYSCSNLIIDPPGHGRKVVIIFRRGVSPSVRPKNKKTRCSANVAIGCGLVGHLKFARLVNNNLIKSNYYNYEIIKSL